MGTAEQDFTAFYDATWSRTVACAYAVTGELAAAEDVAQDAYAKAWPRWSKLRTYDDPGAWVRQVATRQAISRWRRLRTANRFLQRSRPPETTAPPDETTVALVSALRQLPEAQGRASSSTTSPASPSPTSRPWSTVPKGPSKPVCPAAAPRSSPS